MRTTTHIQLDQTLESYSPRNRWRASVGTSAFPTGYCPPRVKESPITQNSSSTCRTFASSPSNSMTVSSADPSSRSTHIPWVGQGPQKLSSRMLKNQFPLVLNEYQPSELVQTLVKTNSTPVASASGISIFISLAEPAIFLQGFDRSDEGNMSPAVLRGSVVVRVEKEARVKKICLNLFGKSKTHWPQGIPLDRTKLYDKHTFLYHSWPFYDAKFCTDEGSFGADLVYLYGKQERPLNKYAPRDIASGVKKLAKSIKHMLSRTGMHILNKFRYGSRGSNEPPKQRTCNALAPGEYMYNFELPIDNRFPESIKVDCGYVTYHLEAMVRRAGTFRRRVLGTKDIKAVRLPSPDSMEQIQPTGVRATWRGKAFYEVNIPGKSFPLGPSIPVSITFTPVEDMLLHAVKAFVNERIEYRITGTKALWVEQKDPVHVFSRSFIDDCKAIGKLRAEETSRHIKRDACHTSRKTCSDPGTEKLEFEVELQAPPASYSRNWLHVDTTFHDIQVSHSLAVTISISERRVDSPAIHRHFLVTVNIPFRILAPQAETDILLPAYLGSCNDEKSDIILDSQFPEQGNAMSEAEQPADVQSSECLTPG